VSAGTQASVRRRRFIGAALLTATAPVAFADATYPSRPITLVVPFAGGGIADLTARVVAEAMGQALQQPMVIDNRPSAGNIVGTAAVAQARPDGYTLLLMSNGNAVSASLFRRLPFDVNRDFAPISTLGFFDLAIFANGGSRYASLASVVEDARKRPGKLTIGTIALGSTQNQAAELFKSSAGIDALIVPYKGSPAVLNAVRAGEIDIAFEILGPMLAQIKGGAVRALAVTAQTRLDVLGDVPTVREAIGLRDYVVASWNALAAPAGTPAAIIERVGAAARTAIAAPAVRQRLAALGVRPQAGTPAELHELLTREIDRWRSVILAAHIPPQ
jgi:tripartite-type tricarboxylate transporter receptor subunit TctC